jgi:hypothetical protein
LNKYYNAIADGNPKPIPFSPQKDGRNREIGSSGNQINLKACPKILQKEEKRPARPPLLDFTHRYFGGGVVVPLEPFLLFFPPLWLLVLVLLVAFLPEVVGVVAVLSVEPPVAWAKDKLAPSSRVNAIVSSFFIQFLPYEILLLVPVLVNPGDGR